MFGIISLVGVVCKFQGPDVYPSIHPSIYIYQDATGLVGGKCKIRNRRTSSGPPVCSWWLALFSISIEGQRRDAQVALGRRLLYMSSGGGPCIRNRRAWDK